MQRFTTLLFLGLCVVMVNTSSQRRQKRDTRSVIDDALKLYYYGTNWKMPKIRMNTKTLSTSYCGYNAHQPAYYLKDIIGQADNIGSEEECLSGCMNIRACFAVNYVKNLKQCVALRSGTTDTSELLRDNALGESSHIMIVFCNGKTSKPATRPYGGSAPSRCGIPYFQQNLLASARTRIIGGTEAVPYSYPWIGRLTYDNGDPIPASCGSSLIMSSSSTESDLAITAAHCVLNSDKSDTYLNRFTLYFGNHDIRFKEAQEQIVGVKNIFYHELFDFNEFNSDIAVIKLARPIKFNNYIRPICLANKRQVPKDKSLCITVGWGRVSNSNLQTANRLQQLKFTVQDDKVCSSPNVWGKDFNATTMTCAGPLDGSVSPCNGDSGGSLACFEDGHWSLYGVTSFGINKRVNDVKQCAVANKPLVFARISGLRDWIDKVKMLLY